MKYNNILFILTLLCCSVCLTTSYAQQDTQFTQYMYNTETINPAYAGSRGSLEFTSLYRNQWVGLEGAPETINFTGNAPLGERVGLGLTFTKDEIGPAEESTIAVDFSYTLPVNNSFNFSFGIKGGINLLNVDYTLLNIDPDNVFQFNVDNRLTPIIGLGAYAYSNKWYMGLSVPSVLETTHYDDSTISNATEKPTLYAIGGYVFDLSDNIKFKPAVLGKFTSNASAAIDISANFLFHEKFTMGVAYRYDAAVSALAGFQISEQILIGYAYDYSVSGLGNYSSGSHEIFLRFEVFKSPSRAISPRFF